MKLGAEGSLAQRLAWLTGLRLVVLTVFLVVTAAVYGYAPGGQSSRIAFITVTAAYGLAAVYAVLLRVGRRLRKVAYAQLATDQITWTAIVTISGGAASGATSLYGLTVLTGAILLGLRGIVVAAAVGTTAYLGVCAALIQRVLLPPSDQHAELYALTWNDAAYPLFVNLLAVLVVASLAGYLAERVRATGGRLVLATARAEEAERLAGLAAGLAHEIRNPLGAIAGSIELLRTGGTLSVEDVRLCQIIERETQRLNDLVGDMMDLSKPKVPARSTFDVAAMSRDLAMLAERQGRGTDVRVRYEGLRAARVDADPAQLRQVVWNLLRNAIQASKAGDEVTVRVAREGDGPLGLAITDRGEGIAEEARARIFDAFFTTRSHGMGVGLAVVKRILDDHAFGIDVDSRDGGGTTFRVQIPPDATRPDAAPDDDVPSSD